MIALKGVGKMTKFEVLVQDITTIKADIIVNAANELLLGGGGVDGAIHRAAGKELLEECKTLNGCYPGDAKVTKAYKLPAKYIIHTVGPRYYMLDEQTAAEKLASCYHKSIDLAVELQAKSIVFPAISCGVFAYPPADAAEIAVKTIAKHPEIDKIDRVIFSVVDERMAEIYRRELQKQNFY